VRIDSVATVVPVTSITKSGWAPIPVRGGRRAPRNRSQPRTG